MAEIMMDYGWIIILVVVIGTGLIVLSHRKFGGETVNINLEQAAALVADHKAQVIDLAEANRYKPHPALPTHHIPGIHFVQGEVSYDTSDKAVILIPMKGLVPMPVIEYFNQLGVPKIYILK
ncbi:MAG TPA: hypothetical protein DCR13_00170 [Gammaproteobacteria bacterium]|nr:hypothetical protein [Gammaproteobacteria bacterium]